MGLDDFKLGEDLKDRRGVITGAGSGMGREAALLLARQGARLALADLDQQGLEQTAHMVEEAGGLPPFSAGLDVNQPERVEEFMARAAKKLGGMDFLVNSAGILTRTPFAGTELEEWDRVMAVNLRGIFICCRAALEHMSQDGQASIVNVASIAGRTPSLLGGAAYTASKHGVVGLSRHMARELGPLGIRVNAFCPGATLTSMVHECTGEQELEALARAHPLRRLAQPDEQARVIAFLVSRASSFMTGVALDSNGGALMV